MPVYAFLSAHKQWDIEAKDLVSAIDKLVEQHEPHRLRLIDIDSADLTHVLRELQIESINCDGETVVELK